jgi:SAM-dependent methyltransferase
MSVNSYCSEDLAQQAATQYRLAQQFCDRCRTYHAIWPYRRLARVVATADASAPGFESTLDALFKTGKRKVLIAGAADTGLLALTARTGAAYDVEITVLDRCRTPLELCRQFAERWSLTSRTLHQDLTGLDLAAEFDIVFANSVLMFIAPDLRVDVLRRLGRALRPDGRLVNVFNAGPRIRREDSVATMLAEMERRGIALPESSETFTRELIDFAREQDSRDGTLFELDQVLALHELGGFKVMRCVETDMGVTSPWQRLAGKRRYLIEGTPAQDRCND